MGLLDSIFGGGQAGDAEDANDRAENYADWGRRIAEFQREDAQDTHGDIRRMTQFHHDTGIPFSHQQINLDLNDRQQASQFGAQTYAGALGMTGWGQELGGQFTGMLGDFMESTAQGAPTVSGGGFSGREFSAPAQFEGSEFSAPTFSGSSFSGREFSGREFSGREYDAGETNADFSQAELDREFLEQLDAARQGGNEMFDEYRDEYGEYRGLRQQIRDDALNYNSDRYANHLAGQAAADAARNQRQQQRAMHSQAASMGLNPNSGRFAAMQQGQSMRNAAQLASAQSNARMQADEIGYQRLMAAEQTGAFLPDAMRQNQEIDLGYQTIAGDYYRAGLEGRVGLERERMAQQAGRDAAGIQTTQRSRAAAQQATATTHNAATQATASTHNAANQATASTINSANAASASAYGAATQATASTQNAAMRANASMHNAATQATASTINSANAANASTQSSAMAANANMYNTNMNAQLGALDIGLGFAGDLFGAGVNLANAGSNAMGTTGANQSQGLRTYNTLGNSRVNNTATAANTLNSGYNAVTGALSNAAGTASNSAGVHAQNYGSNLGFAGDLFGALTPW